MSEKLKPCWGRDLPDLIKKYYMCNQMIIEHMPHVLIADCAEYEKEARRNWNRLMNAIEKHYREGE